MSTTAATPVTSGLLDTSVLVDLASIDATALPEQLAVCAISIAELAAGPHASPDPVERAVRQALLQWVEGTFDPLPFDVEAARAYGRVHAAVAAAGRTAPCRSADLLIAAVALSNGLVLVTRNAADLVGLDELVDIRSA